MDILKPILLRKSCPRSEGQVAEADLHVMLECALAAPDHKRMRRTRYLVCQPGKKAELVERISAATYGSSYSPAHVQGLRKKLDFAPTLIIVIVDCSVQDVIPRDELILAAGAAIQNLLIAAEALGYRSAWKSGNWARPQAVRELLGIAGDEEIVGVVGVGQGEGAAADLASLNRPVFAQHVREIASLALDAPA